MPPVNTGKPGTIKPEEFEELSELVENYGAKLLAKKVSKICSKFSMPFKHEYANSAIAAAWLTVSTKIGASLNGVNGTVSNDAFEFLGSLVNTYGPEVVVNKLAKIASKSGDTASANSLKTIFPMPAARRAA